MKIAILLAALLQILIFPPQISHAHDAERQKNELIDYLVNSFSLSNATATKNHEFCIRPTFYDDEKKLQINCDKIEVYGAGNNLVLVGGKSQIIYYFTQEKITLQINDGELGFHAHGEGIKFNFGQYQAQLHLRDSPKQGLEKNQHIKKKYYLIYDENLQRVEKVFKNLQIQIGDFQKSQQNNIIITDRDRTEITIEQIKIVTNIDKKTPKTKLLYDIKAENGVIKTEEKTFKFNGSFKFAFDNVNNKLYPINLSTSEKALKKHLEIVKSLEPALELEIEFDIKDYGIIVDAQALLQIKKDLSIETNGFFMAEGAKEILQAFEDNDRKLSDDLQLVKEILKFFSGGSIKVNISTKDGIAYVGKKKLGEVHDYDSIIRSFIDELTD